MKLKKYKFGDYLNAETAPFAGMAGNLVDVLDPGNEFGVRSNLAAGASGVLKGASAGMVAGPWGALAGGVIGGLTSVFGNEKAKKEERRIRQERLERATSLIKNQSQQVLSTFPSQGIMTAKYGTYLPMRPAGGYLPYPTDDSEVKQLSSNAAVYEGDTHANGGIPIDTNQDNQADIEIEDGEVIKDNMVLSNRLKPSKEVLEQLKGLGVNIKSDDTYASLAERYAKKKGEYETNLKSTRLGEAGTAKLMLERLNSAVDTLFQDQEFQKINKNISNDKMRFGGYLRKMTEGGTTEPGKPKIVKGQESIYNYFTSKEPKEKGFVQDRGWVTREEYNAWKKAWQENQVPWNTPLQGNQNLFWEGFGVNKVKDAFDSDPNISRIHIGKFDGDAINKWKYPQGAPANYVPFTNDNAAIIEMEMMTPVTKNKQTTEKSSKVKESQVYPTNFGAISGVSGGRGAFKPSGATKAYGMSYAKGGMLPKYKFGDILEALQGNTGLLATGIGTLANQAQINKLETEFTPDVAPAPVYNFTNRMPYLRDQVFGAYRTATQGLRKWSAR